MIRFRGAAGLLAVAAAVVAYAWPIQGGGGVSNAHYALTKALASGTPEIEGVLAELGDFATEDYAIFDGRKYANKAPGFALVAVAPYLVLREAGVRVSGDPARMLWALGLVAVVVPSAALLVLVRGRGEAAAAGFGTAAAVAAGVGTILLPYATIFLSHLLAAALLFGAFAILWRERARTPRLAWIAAAGVLAGYGIAVEYPNAIGAAILAAYAALSPDRVRRVATFGAFCFLGALPLALYNQWAFGDVFHSSYSGVGGQPASDLFGAPSARVALELLLSANGLLVLSPVAACACAGLVLLHRGGLRAESIVIAAVVAAYVVFNSAYFSPFGGVSPGTRHLIVALPFLAVGLAPAFRTWPVTSAALALVSTLVATLITATHALAGADGRWLERLRDGQVTQAVPSLVGITGWYGMLPFALAVATALVAAALATPAVRVTAADAALAPFAVFAWGLGAAGAPRGAEALEFDAYGPALGAALAVAAAVGGGAYASGVAARRRS